jgi:S-adenosylmethionine/arginine decarboxylase-like enzyme
MEQESEVIELWPTAQTNSGIHLLIEWFGCECAPRLLRDVAALRRLCLGAANEAELPVLAELFRPHDGTGVTGTMLMAESHLTIHTWPAARSVALDVFVGAKARGNRAQAHAVHATLRDAMLPDKENLLSVNRGDRARAAAAIAD